MSTWTPPPPDSRITTYQQSVSDTSDHRYTSTPSTFDGEMYGPPTTSVISGGPVTTCTTSSKVDGAVYQTSTGVFTSRITTRLRKRGADPPPVSPEITTPQPQIEYTAVINIATSEPGPKPSPVTRITEGRLHEGRRPNVIQIHDQVTISTIPAAFIALHSPGLVARSTYPRPGPRPPIITVTPPQKATRPDPAIPEMPHVAKFMIAVSIMFLFVVAVSLYYANFPHPLRFLRHERSGYKKLPQESGGTERGRHSATASAIEVEERQHTRIDVSPHLRQRVRQSLSINTQAGLGISFGPESGTYSSRSFDEEVLRPVPKTLPSPWQVMTAPLPSIKLFAPEEGRRYQRSKLDLETGLPLSPGEVDMFDSRSTSLYTPESVPEHQYGEPYFGRLNTWIETAAEKTSKCLYDHVGKDPEEGLLLSVRKSERETVRISHVHAE